MAVPHRIRSMLVIKSKGLATRFSLKDISPPAESSAAVVSKHHREILPHGQPMGAFAGLQQYFSSSRTSMLESVKNPADRPLATIRSLSGEAEPAVSDHDYEVLDYPGARTNFISKIQFIPNTADEPVPCFRLLDEYGQLIPFGHDPHELQQVDLALAQKMYKNMVTLQTMDTLFYEAQRQGRFSFYLTTNGEEAINIGTAAALSIEDVIFSQYREPGIFMWRGFTVQDFANQCFSNSEDLGKGRQMPIHYGSRELNCHTISSPLTTQLPQAVGAAYALKMAGTPACSVALFGDGASSEGDFHAAMNFAATLETPTLFICRNNGWAISTPTKDQFRSDGIVVKGQSYGIRSIRVDGNDTLAMYFAIRAARKIAIEECQPVLVEALSYRVSHHSTSDDSSKYRSRDEINHWKIQRDPVLRFKRWMDANGWWNEDVEAKLRVEKRKEVIMAMTKAENLCKPKLSTFFEDVYNTVPPHLKEQEMHLRGCIARKPQDYWENVLL